MAEFHDVCKQWRRMCQSFEDKAAKDYRPCAELCPIGCNPVCGELCESTQEDVERFEAAIMKWAAEHPVVYPTWGEWFVEHGDLVDGWQNATNSAWMANTALNVFMNPIPADIAEKLGLQPKEVER